MAGAIKIALTGAAGLVGQNLIPRLKARGYINIVALDKHKPMSRSCASCIRTSW